MKDDLRAVQPLSYCLNTRTEAKNFDDEQKLIGDPSCCWELPATTLNKKKKKRRSPLSALCSLLSAHSFSRSPPVCRLLVTPLMADNTEPVSSAESVPITEVMCCYVLFVSDSRR